MPENTASQLRAVLPTGLTDRLDLGRLSRVPASFVDEALRWRYSDLLFTAPLDGRDVFVYLLVEHQSGADQLMAYRMLRYVTRIWGQHLRDHPGTAAASGDPAGRPPRPRPVDQPGAAA